MSVCACGYISVFLYEHRNTCIHMYVMYVKMIHADRLGVDAGEGMRGQAGSGGAGGGWRVSQVRYAFARCMYTCVSVCPVHAYISCTHTHTNTHTQVEAEGGRARIKGT